MTLKNSAVDGDRSAGVYTVHTTRLTKQIGLQQDGPVWPLLALCCKWTVLASQTVTTGAGASTVVHRS